jgi:two-component system, NarL family, nitrate/nitrite response regulator NarL
MKRVHLYSDQPMLVKGLESVLAATDTFCLEASFSALQDLLARLETDVPDVLLLELTPEVTFGALSDIKRVARECKMILWVNAISTELAFQAMGLGVRGILRKTLPAELQVKCLHKVSDGELWFEKALTDSFLTAKRVVLSQREGQLITLLSNGFKNKEIAAALHISEGTVKVYLSRLFQKVGVKDRFELALFGLKNMSAGQSQTTAKNGDTTKAPTHNLHSLVLEWPAGRAPSPPAPAYVEPRRPSPPGAPE